MVEPLRVHLMGRLVVDGFGERELGSRKGRRLLKALALAEGAPVRADALVEILWPGATPKEPADQLGILVSRLRRVVGPERIERVDAGYRLDADWIDVTEIRARTDEAVRALAAGRLGAARAAALAALTLAAGELLPDEEGEWVDVARAQVVATVAAARRAAVAAAADAADHVTVIREAEASLTVDPYDESMVEALMRAHATSGRIGSALAAYARLRQRLAEDLGSSPTPEVEALHTQLVVGAPAPGEQPEPPGPPGLFGRAAELAALDRVLSTVRGGRSQTVVIEGEPGIGKTTLVRGWLASVRALGATVFESRCDELGRDLPLQPVADALAAALESAGEDIERIRIDDRRVLAEALGIGELPREPGEVDHSEAPAARLYVAILRAVEVLAGDWPAIVFIDDLHLAGRSTLEWLAFAARRSSNVLLIGARRAGDLSALPDAVIVEVGPLPIEAVAQMVGGQGSVELHAHSGGNPLLLSALVAGPRGPLPATVSDAVKRQLAALGSADDTLLSAAVLGQEIDLDLVASVMRSSAIDVLGSLERSAAAGLLAEGASGFRFRHELIREALVAEVSTARQTLVHRSAARVLVERADADPASVAHHAAFGGDRVLAAESLRRAAVAAEARHDLAAAENYLDAAMELTDEAATLIARARIRMSVSRLEEAATDAARAIEAGGGAPALEIASWVAYYRRRYDEAEAWADETAALATEPESRIGALAVGGRIRHGRGDLPGALRTLAAAEEGPPRVRAVADVWHAHALVHGGDPAAALRFADHALAAGDRLAQPFAPLHGRFARTMALGHLGRLHDAAAGAEDLATVLDRFGAVGTRFVGPSWNVRAWTSRTLGRHAEADEANQEALTATRGADGPLSPAMAEAYWVALLDLTDSALLAGDLDRAHDFLERLTPMVEWTGTMAWHQRHRLDLLRARARIAVGDADGAAELARAVAADARERQAGRYAAIASAVAIAAAPAPDDAIELVCSQLERCAAAEAWWLTAMIAARTGSDALRARAGTQAARLVRSAGPDPTSLRRWVDRLLG